ncbi:RelA/SpoT domain-containing protein [Caulobacter segnis]|uniref:RelA/SpoT domain-containing protein n=1 Tax=Caulobacter segnis TaxID=88688 RepID=UPI00240EBB85|nr:RelA/SpoT domain-containing protein [Caulobacter segnis]MDG2523173.1 RelA/SpoT domain-containing protein [Caulobacter segnis]
MAWATPEYDLPTVNAAGKKLIEDRFPLSDDSMLKVVNNWRSIHSYPLNAFQITLRRRGRQFEKSIIVSQRIKRLESIHAKLMRQSSMRLSQMQDVAGCRIVFKDIRNVRRLVDRYKRGSKKGKLEHKLVGEKDYIRYPKADGYRSYHLVYEYTGSSKSACWSGRKIEIQVRTQLQHAWATAVEAVGIFTRQALKSNQGDEEWRRFFALMATAIAAIEGCAPVPGVPTDRNKLNRELGFLASKLNVEAVLAAYNMSLNYTAERVKEAKYFLVDLDPATRNVKVARFRARQSEAANETYTEWERRIPEGSDRQVVLVSVDSISALKRAYPNYFLDTGRFADLVSQVLRDDYPDPLIG